MPLISKLPELLKHYELETAEDNVFDVYNPNEYWDRDNENEYNEVCRKLDNLSKQYKKYKFHVWYDISGFDYWIVKMQEPNYAQITITFNEDVKTLSRKEITTLDYRLNEFNNKVHRILTLFL